MQQVKIHISTRMKQQGQSIEQTCFGKRCSKAGGWYYVYKEDLGEGQKVLSTIKVNEGKATITRTGAVRMRQEYIAGQWTEGKYEGAFGMMWMETKTEQVKGTGDQFLLVYRLKLNGEDMGRYEIAMNMEVI